MKITRILPKPFAKSYQEYDLRKSESGLEYHQVYVRVLEERVREGREELERLRRQEN